MKQHSFDNYRNKAFLIRSVLLPFEGTEDVRVVNVSWDRIPKSRGLEHERSLAKGFGVCSGNRKVPFAASPERTGGLAGGETGRQVREEKSAVQVVKSKSAWQSCTLFCIWREAGQCSSRRRVMV